MNKIKILVACEESQAVTKEFRKLGFEAYSCDLLPTSGENPEWHIQSDVTRLISKVDFDRQFETQSGSIEILPKEGWDAIIAFPPCTDLAVSGARHFERKIADGSQQKSIEFFMMFANAECEYVAIENPIGIMSGKYRKPDQIIQPWQFGDKAQKSTCLWLKGFSKLEHTEIVDKGEFFEFVSKKGENKRMPMWYYKALQDAKTPEQRRTLRSKTFEGIAKAMAKQFGDNLKSEKTTLF